MTPSHSPLHSAYVPPAESKQAPSAAISPSQPGLNSSAAPVYTVLPPGGYDLTGLLPVAPPTAARVAGKKKKAAKAGNAGHFGSELPMMASASDPVKLIASAGGAPAGAGVRAGKVTGAGTGAGAAAGGGGAAAGRADEFSSRERACPVCLGPCV